MKEKAPSYSVQIISEKKILEKKSMAEFNLKEFLVENEYRYLVHDEFRTLQIKTKKCQNWKSIRAERNPLHGERFIKLIFDDNSIEKNLFTDNISILHYPSLFMNFYRVENNGQFYLSPFTEYFKSLYGEDLKPGYLYSEKEVVLKIISLTHIFLKKTVNNCKCDCN